MVVAVVVVVVCKLLMLGVSIITTGSTPFRHHNDDCHSSGWVDVVNGFVVQQQQQISRRTNRNQQRLSSTPTTELSRKQIKPASIVMKHSYDENNNNVISSYSNSNNNIKYRSIPTIATTVATASPSTIITATTTATSTAAVSTTTTTTNWDDWWLAQLQFQYHQVLSIKCPFFRRRFSDILDGMDMILQFIVVRHKSLPVPVVLVSTVVWPSLSLPMVPSRLRHRHGTSGILVSDKKLNHLPIEELVVLIQEDWKTATHKGYYVTGKLTTAIYQDDTIFDGPDPDMPVRGLYKYLNAASQLFDTKHTYSELLSIQTQQQQQQQQPATASATNNNSSNHHHCPTRIVATWKMHGVLRLPWKPIVPEWTGTTTYCIHPTTGLIYQHLETWDISVVQAFVQTLFPSSIVKYIYGGKR